MPRDDYQYDLTSADFAAGEAAGGVIAVIAWFVEGLRKLWRGDFEINPQPSRKPHDADIDDARRLH